MSIIKVGDKRIKFPDTMSKEDIKIALDKMHNIQSKPTETSTYEEYIKPILKPTVETLGTIGGGLLGSVAAPVAGSIAGAGLGYAGAKAGYEGLENLIKGNFENRLPTLEETGTKTIETAGDVATGMLTEVGGQTAPLALKGAAKMMKTLKDWSALKTINPTASELKSLPYVGQSKQTVAETLQKNKIPSMSTDSMLDKTKEALNKSGNVISDTLGQIDSNNIGKTYKMTGTDLINSLNQVKDKVSKSLAFDKSNVASLDDKIIKIKEQYGDRELSFKEVNSIISDFSNAIRKFGKENVGSQEVLREGRTALKNSMDKTLTAAEQLLLEAGEKGVVGKGALNNAKKDYSNLSTIEDILENSSAREEAKAFLNPMSILTGTTSGLSAYQVTQDPKKAALYGLLGGMAGKYVPRAAAVGTANYMPNLTKYVTPSVQSATKGLSYLPIQSKLEDEEEE